MEPKSYRDSRSTVSPRMARRTSSFFTHTVNPPQYFSNRKANFFPSEFVTMISPLKVAD